jgi:aryl-alcohol dehydrogenase-like predicted oxidoreductase
MNVLEEIRTILTSDGRTLAQAAIAWLWTYHDKVIPIPGFKTVLQVEENVRSLELGLLPKEQFKQIDELFVELKMDLGDTPHYANEPQQSSRSN